MMQRIKLNRKHKIFPDEIEKVASKDKIVWVYRKEGLYPRILKTDHNKDVFLLRCVNAQVSEEIIIKWRNQLND